MVKLSPKALRFAEAATRRGIEHGLLEGDREAIWSEWSRQDAWRHADDRLPSSAGFIEVSDEIASVFLDAIQKMVFDLEHLSRAGIGADHDSDLGNDLEFLHAIENSIRLELASMPDLNERAVDRSPP